MLEDDISLKKLKIKELAILMRDYEVPPYILHRDYIEEIPELVKVYDILHKDILTELEKMDKEKVLDLAKKLGWFCEETVSEKLRKEESFDKILSFISDQYLANLVVTEYYDLTIYINDNKKEWRLFEIYPEIRNKIDEDGLVALNKDFILNRGSVRYKNHDIHYSPFLRRNYRNSANFNFFEELSRISQKDKCEVKVRIDLDRFADKNYSHLNNIFEKEYWFGPRFKNAFDLNKDGMTYCHPPRNEKSFWYDGFDHLEAYHSIVKESERSIVIEEIRNKDNNHNNFVINRYVHSKLNCETKNIFHLDGAVRIYQTNNYDSQIEKKVHDRKGDIYHKLFRIDGDITTDDWVSIVANFFLGNELIFDYLDIDRSL